MGGCSARHMSCSLREGRPAHRPHDVFAFEVNMDNRPTSNAIPPMAPSSPSSSPPPPPLTWPDDPMSGQDLGIAHPLHSRPLPRMAVVGQSVIPVRLQLPPVAPSERVVQPMDRSPNTSCQGPNTSCQGATPAGPPDVAASRDGVSTCRSAPIRHVEQPSALPAASQLMVMAVIEVFHLPGMSLVTWTCGRGRVRERAGSGLRQ
jgi:hypothetical protein